jgi:hypothetical protein
MSPFQWKILGFLMFLFLAFGIATLTVTLIMISEIRADTIDYDKVTFVEVANWIFVGILGISCIMVLIGTPYFLAYTRRSESILSTGLKPAQKV